MMNQKRGFTLVEMIVVLSVIGLLVGGIALSLPKQGSNARDNRRKVDLEQIRAALELYRSDQPNGNYPASTADLSPTYLSIVPTDPSTSTAYTYVSSPGGCTTAGPTFCVSYRITANLEVGGTSSLGPQDIAR